MTDKETTLERHDDDDRERQKISDLSLALANELMAIAGINPEFVPPGWCGTALQVQTWLNDGCTAEMIRVAFQTVMARRKTAPNTPAYFRNEVANQRRILAQPLPKPQGGLHGKPGHNSVAAAVERLDERYRSEEAAKGHR